MTKKIYFSVGPSELYPKVEQYYQEAFDLQLGSIHHRSDQFMELYKFTENQLRKLMNIPDTHSIFFLSSATEIWERLILNFVEKKSVHFVNGIFSHRFYEFSKELGRDAVLYDKNHGEGFEKLDEVNYDSDVELICTTQNETASGIQFPVDQIYLLKEKFPKAILSSDIVSSAPIVNIDYKIMDSSYFSVQKAFGLPPGLGVWIINQSCIEQYENLSKKQSISPNNRIDHLMRNYTKNQTTYTPNTLAIYVLGKVAEDMNRYGLEKIRNETKEKSNLIYQFLDSSTVFKPITSNLNLRSETTIVAKVENSQNVIDFLAKEDIVVSSGYGSYKETELRIGNFPAISIEKVQILIEKLKYFEFNR